MRHQVETYNAIRGRIADVIFHAGMTGDGKSLAGYTAAMVYANHRVLAMYPTNELIADQHRQLKALMGDWHTPRDIEELNARTLDQQMDTHDVDRPTALLSFLNNADILLTNPDVFYYIVAGRYNKQGYHPLKTLQDLMFMYKQITIDEFHLFDQGQITALLTAIVFIKQVCGDRAPVFLLQSATPDEALKKALKGSGLTFHEIDCTYEHSAMGNSATHRTILQGVDLSFTTEKIPDWLEQNGESLRTALTDGGRGAALFTGVFSALEALPAARQALPGLNVQPNTGLTPRSVREASRAADLLIGTATVDTGVDLQINRLIFEAYDAGNFKQRLGRLGRHAAYQDNTDRSHTFKDFAAIASIPAWITAQIEDEAALNMSRQDFFALVDAAYSGKRGEIFAYNRYWGWLLAFELMNRIAKGPLKDQYRDILPVVKTSLEAALGLKNLNAFGARYKALYATPDQKHIVQEAFTFRGSSALTAMILNEDYSGAERYQFYDLLSLLPRMEFEVLDFHLTMIQAKTAGVPERTLEREKPVIALKWHGVSRDRRRLTLELDSSAWRAAESKIAEGVFATQNLMVRTDPAAALGEPALKKIRAQTVMARVVMNTTPSALHQRLRLGTFFPLYHFETYEGSFGVIALGREALLLDAAVAYLREDDPGALIF